MRNDIFSESFLDRYFPECTAKVFGIWDSGNMTGPVLGERLRSVGTVLPSWNGTTLSFWLFTNKKDDQATHFAEIPKLFVQP